MNTVLIIAAVSVGVLGIVYWRSDNERRAIIRTTLRQIGGKLWYLVLRGTDLLGRQARSHADKIQNAKEKGGHLRKAK